MAEIGTPDDEHALPLAIAGPQSNGYWAMWIFLLVMAVAFATIIACYFYLGDGPATWPPITPDATQAAWTVAAAVVLAVATFWMARSMRRKQTWGWRVGTAVAFVSTPLLAYLTAQAWSAIGLVAKESAYASIFLATIGFNWVLQLLLFLMLLFTLVWAVTRPADIRGHGLAWLTELQGYFTAACWLLSYAVLYLTPRLW